VAAEDKLAQNTQYITSVLECYISIVYRLVLSRSQRGNAFKRHW